jgi:MFS family permease
VSDKSRTEITYRYEQWRAISSGILETAGATFLLLIAVRWFHAGPIAKGLIASGGSLGLLLAPFVVSFVENRKWPTSLAASRIAATGACFFLVPALLAWLPMTASNAGFVEFIFVVCCVIAMACSSGSIPLLTQIYQENYPVEERGSRFSRTLVIRIGITALFSELAGRLLNDDIERYRWLLFVFAGAFMLASYCLRRCPSRPLVGSGGTHPLRALRFAARDRIFRLTLISWMFLGFGTLMMQPMRVEYLANPKYGQFLEISVIALITGVIPNVVRLVLSPVWGWLFDHMNFFLLRVTLNVGFAVAIFTFFMSDSFTGLIWGAVIFGISNSGGDVAWSLWVTKFAPPERVADYMSAHTFFTGLRGVIAPFLSFQLVSHGLPVHVLGWIATGLILCAVALLIPEVKFGRSTKKAAALVEEVSE